MTDIKDIKAAKDRVVEHLKDRHPCLVLDEEGVITEVRGSSGQARWSSGLVIRSSGEVDWQLFDLLARELGVSAAVGVTAVQILDRLPGAGVCWANGVLIGLLDSHDDITAANWLNGDDIRDLEEFVSQVVTCIQSPTPFARLMMSTLSDLISGPLLSGEDLDEEQERRILDLYSFVSGEILDRSIPNDMRTTRIISNHLRYVLSDEDLEFLLDYLDTLEGPDLSDKKSVLSWWREWWSIVLSVLNSGGSEND